MSKGEHFKGTHERPMSSGPRGVFVRTGGVNAHLDDCFYNACDPRGEVTYEKPWHRVAIFMATNGKTNAEIARALGRSDHQVSEVLRQPWAQERIQREVAAAGRDNLQELLTIYGPNALFQVIDLGTSAKSEQVKLAANREVLDRWLGKPKESVVVTEKPASEMSDEELKASVNNLLNDFGNTTNQQPVNETARVPDPAVG